MGAAILLADELALHLLLEFLAHHTPGFAETFTAQADVLITSPNLPATTLSALTRLRDFVAQAGIEN